MGFSDRALERIKWFVYKRVRDNHRDLAARISPRSADRCGENVLWYKRNSVERRAGGGYVEIGDHCRIEGALICHQPESRIVVGSRTSIGGETVIESLRSVVIGEDCLISHHVTLQDHNSHSLNWNHRKNDVIDWIAGRKDWTYVKQADVVIGPKCWIGTRSLILKGVHLGEGTVVGAGSVVTKSFPEYSVIAGNPACLIKQNEDRNLP